MLRAPYLREVRCFDGVVILDVENDIYSCCYEPADESGVAASRNQDTVREAWIDLPPPRREKLRLIDLVRFSMAFAATTLRLARFRFRDLADRELEAASYSTATRNPLDVLAPVVDRFERMALWLPMRDKCLFRSAFLIEFLKRYGLRGNWIFGVSLFPFKAHCWVADGHLLLGERGHRIARFRTIFIAAPAMP